MELNQDQQAAAAAFSLFVLSTEKQMVISGPAGTGKTTLLRHLMEQQDHLKLEALLGTSLNLPRHWRLTATTNKAAEALQKATGLEATTIHSALGLRVMNDFETGETKVTRTKDSNIIHDSLIVVDECSMVDTPLRRFIDEGTVNCKIIYVGDHCQLAPIKEPISPVFAGQDPIKLTQVMRSQHTPAITALCTQLRQSVEDGIFRPLFDEPGVIDFLNPAEAQREIEDTFVHDPHANARILCFRNQQVVGYNNHLRNARGLPEHYTPGEWVVSNTMSYAIGPKGNSPILRVEEEVEILDVSEPENFGFHVRGTNYDLPVYRVHTPKGSYRVPVNVDEYRELVKYVGRLKEWMPYFLLKEQIADLRPRDACTVHKSQGSTYHTAFVDLSDIGRCTNPGMAARLLYVACSRPTTRICFIGQLPERFRGG